MCVCVCVKVLCVYMKECMFVCGVCVFVSMCVFICNLLYLIVLENTQHNNNKTKQKLITDGYIFFSVFWCIVYINIILY